MDVREMDSSNTSAYSLIVAQNLNSDMINGLSVSPLHEDVKCPEYCNEEKSSVEQTAEYFHCRVPSAKGHHRQGAHPRKKQGWRVVLSSLMLHSCVWTQIMMLQCFILLLHAHTLLITSSTPLTAGTHWAPQSAFPRGWGTLREEFHPRGTSMEWLTWKIFVVQKYSLYIYFTKDRVTSNLICACTGVW